MTINCGHKSSQVLDTRLKHTSLIGWHKHRRRQCNDCGAKFSTKEVRYDLCNQLTNLVRCALNVHRRR